MLAQRGPGGPKAAPMPAVTLSKDWNFTMGTLLLKAEKASDSLERMLAVCRRAPRPSRPSNQQCSRHRAAPLHGYCASSQASFPVQALPQLPPGGGAPPPPPPPPAHPPPRRRRAVLAFLSAALRPGARFADTACVALGQHHLSHRELGELHRGDPTRVYLQELCTHHPGDGPVRPAKYGAEGHADVAAWALRVTPVR